MAPTVAHYVLTAIGAPFCLALADRGAGTISES